MLQDIQATQIQCWNYSAQQSHCQLHVTPLLSTFYATVLYSTAFPQTETVRSLLYQFLCDKLGCLLS